jgi:hypothetical protein
MIGPAAFAFAIGLHSFSIKVTIHPDSVPTIAQARHPAIDRDVPRSARIGRYLMRMAVRMIAGRAPVSPVIAAYHGYAAAPLDNFKLPASFAPHPAIFVPAASGSLCLEQASGRMEMRVCGR